jgi:hypothetical protein
VAIILICDALLAFAMPLIYSSTRRLPPSGTGVAWLQARAGLLRIYSMGPIAPNYGAYFKLAQINHNYLPIPNAWVSFIHDRLDPEADSISFIGIDNFPLERKQTASAALRQNLAAYEQIGVRYVVVEPGLAPFSDAFKTGHANDRNLPLALSSASAFTVNLPLPEQVRGKTITQISGMLGNYGNTADGTLHLQVCHAALCVEGARPLSESIDNSAFVIALDHPLPIAGEATALTIRIRQEAATRPAALWMWPLAQDAALTVGGAPEEFANMGPELEVRYAQDGPAPALVYQGRDMDIYELPNPAPYFEAGDARCQVAPASRLALSIQCPAETTLTRKEMHYPGWRASIDGRDTPITVQDGLFQRVQVPKGEHQIAFSYTPSHRPWWLGGFLAGLAILLFSLRREFRGQ